MYMYISTKSCLLDVKFKTYYVHLLLYYQLLDEAIFIGSLQKQDCMQSANWLIYFILWNWQNDGNDHSDLTVDVAEASPSYIIGVTRSRYSFLLLLALLVTVADAEAWPSPRFTVPLTDFCFYAWGHLCIDPITNQQY